MNEREHQVEVLSFRNGDSRATIATDGVRHVSQVNETAREHATLRAAISYLCSQGFVIDPSNFRSV